MSIFERNNLRNLRRYAGRLNRMIEDGSFDAMEPRKRGRLVRRVRYLYESLAGVVSEAALGHVLAAASVVVLGLAGCATGGETYVDTGIDTSVDTIVPDTPVDTPVDTVLDPDADPPSDTILDTGWDTRPDTGTDTPHDVATDDGPGTCLFSTSTSNPFGFEGLTSYVLLPAFADIDGDSDLDLFASVYSYYGSTGLAYWQNTGTATSPAFGSSVTNPFGITTVESFNVPAAADLDGDGDVDLLVGATEYMSLASFKYFQNTGSSTSPSFAAPVTAPFGLVPPASGYVMPLVLVDIDDDSDLDLFVGVYSSGGAAGVAYYQNTGSSSSPSFAAPVRNPFGLAGLSYVASPAFADIDEDGDMDLLLASYDYASSSIRFLYNQNTGTVTSPAFAAAVVNPFCLTWASAGLSTLAFADIDGDGDSDLFTGDYGYPSTGILYYENISTP